jgi:hypothetical protein
MANYTQGISRDKIYFCEINALAVKRFKTKDYVSLPGISSSEFNEAELGLQLTAPSGKLILVGAQSPAPPRVSRPIRNTVDLNPDTQDRISTFCSYLTVATLTKPGVWTITQKSKAVSLRRDVGSTSAIVIVQNLAQLEYWLVIPINTTTFNAVKAPLGLGNPLEITTNIERARLSFRANNPRAGKASKYTVKNGRKSLASHPCSDGIDLIDGWQRVEESIAI